MKHKRIYLDYAAATPLNSAVTRAMKLFFEKQYGNPSSIHEEGCVARVAVENARREIAALLGARPSEIIFTGSGTESVALALHGVMNAHAPGAHIVTSSVEHAAVLKNTAILRQKGYRVSIVSGDADGMVSPERIAECITPETVLVSVQYVNNEIGTVQPLRDIARVVRKERNRRREHKETKPIWFHTDACQAAIYHTLIVEKLGVDLLTLNASKVYGPKGVGLLYKKTQVPLRPLWGGGGQERGLRSGTENVAGIVGFAAALQYAEAGKSKERKRMERLQSHFITALQHAIPDVVLQGSPVGEHRTPCNVYISIPDIAAESLVLFLDAKGVAASTGSACNTNRDILQGVGPGGGGVRFTMGCATTRRDIDYTIKALKDCITILQKAPKLGFRL